MSKVIFHTKTSREVIAENRLFENLKLSPVERLKKAFTLMGLSALFKKGPIKIPQGLGVVLKRKA